LSRAAPRRPRRSSPAGIGFNLDGDVFYAENQGDWIGSGYITHVERGDFVGNPAGLKWTDLPGSPLQLKPEDIPDTGQPLFEVAQSVPALKPPAVWFPHTIMGISTSDILADDTDGTFGPFEGQLFVGDQGHSKIMRVALEQVDGIYQGAVFPFREGFDSGVLRMIWGKDGSMIVGQTSRGWSATGRAPFALQRLVWTGRVPFEVEKIQARPDGFELTFTGPVDPAAAGDPAAYQVTGFTYQYHSTYGSPIINDQDAPVRGVVVADDGRSARLVVDGLREGYIHEIKLPGVRSEGGSPLLHDVAYYTLNRLPGGAPLNLANQAATPSAGGARNAGAGPEQGGGPALPKRLTEPLASWSDGSVTTLTVGTLPGLKFDVETLNVRAGSRVKLVFNNNDDMLHNLVVARPGTADTVADAALRLGLSGHEKQYVPESGDVLFHTNLMEPETAESIYFVAPEAPGDYPFVCTFPGHAITMRGILRVGN
jgi:azurin